jgi:hypothetical protein
MKIIYYGDQTVDIDFVALAQGLNRISGGVHFQAGTGVVEIPDRIISSSTCNKFKLPDHITGQDLALIATTKPYGNNYFYEFPYQIGIISFSGWKDLTSLPIINGLVYFTAQLLCDYIHVGESHDENTGCLNDFLWKKTGIDIGMRSAFICPKCRQDFKFKEKNEEESRIFKTIELVLDQVCLASRSGQSLLDYWKANSQSSKQLLADIKVAKSLPLKVFICYSRKDEEFKEELVTMLSGLQRRRVIDAWQDRRIEEGDKWYQEIQKAMKDCDLAILLVSSDFIASRFIQEEELPRLLKRRMEDGLRVVPIVVRSCMWQSEPALKEIQALPRNGKPVISFQKTNGERDEVWVEIVKAIELRAIT